MLKQLGEESRMKITVYHGATEIVKAPLCKIGRPRLDFGQGFYVTDLKEQAINWAQTLADKRNEKPLLNIYQLDKDAILAEARSKIFTAYDKDWLDFIVGNRQGKNLAKDYDYVEGGIANDRVIDTVKLYIGGIMDEISTLRQLAFHKPNNQICLLNQELTNKYLEYVRTDSI